MNFFEGCTLMKTASEYDLSILGHSVTLTPDQCEKLAASGVGSGAVTVGVRPVHVSLGSSGISATVDVSELMGSELHLHLSTAQGDVVAVVPTAKIDTDAYARHTPLQFSFDPRLLHLFDPEPEKNLF